MDAGLEGTGIERKPKSRDKYGYNYERALLYRTWNRTQGPAKKYNRNM